MKLAIKAENISKQYRLGEVGTGTLSHDLNRFWSKIRGKEDPYLKIGDSNDRTSKGSSDYVWSLRDINFEIEQGDAVGIIGRNGAGKSTLLKLLSKVTKPTTGSFKINGRIASLLEVGTGFNPEMTGRENIYLNGAILGMRKFEIDRKLDEIIAFSGVERYIDTPVKRYSSGMYVRLAFAVAAHLESEILIVDEVLAVGDAEFQKKCLGKMGDVSKGEGRTVLFVSHNMAAVSTLCNKGIYLKNGLVESVGGIEGIINQYITNGQESAPFVLHKDIKYQNTCPHAHFECISIFSEGENKNSVRIDREVQIEIEYRVLTDDAIIWPSIHLLDAMGTCILATFNSPAASFVADPFFGKPLKKGVYKTVCTIPANFLNESSYQISAFLVPQDTTQIVVAQEVLSFNVNETGEMTKDYVGTWIGLIRPKLNWNTTFIS
ncbi:ABC transporter ATP-binding protein [Flavobacterium branchiophilum NBRC 15030 = ATCC 35035]|uniref:ABC-type polysaccharide/polyol phosphate transport system ATPase subunit n=1 Tax=Flavobacterium branchiophilum TaxID=55197 RepID=A0A543G586_9FLAO|nr:ABC transporter ATP-binding protein [Flavobacterium branchiophilum]OXA78073.1 ABC transporter ATP-binding protein [Flavobacterium branchiophilum NBRC 15030 = ATCC 35035]TQM41248.1 ABC-type polysaccharide/polyol phosphate transport system ATPase subunit [Flavobacterium branchiophilum]GEM54394.1 ABC transporter ATP-binding protein [Flavobacterium branchiophilum NBRC 15030 = ATCC 35035]